VNPEDAAQANTNAMRTKELEAKKNFAI